jgi:hypothetical protein
MQPAAQCGDGSAPMCAIARASRYFRLCRAHADGARYRGAVIRTPSVSWVLWQLTATWLVGCGRFDFDALSSSKPSELPDAPIADVAVPADAPPADAPPDTPPPTPALQVPPTLALNTLCGGDPNNTPALLEVTNTGTADLVIDSATLPGTSRFKLGQVPPRIAPGATGKITVVPPVATVGTDRATAVFDETLTLATNAGTRTVALVATVQGANVDLQMPAGVTQLMFSSCSSPQTVTVKNTGTTSITIGQLAASDAAFSGFSGGTIAPGASQTTMVRAFTNGACAASGTLAYQAASGASGLCTTTVLQVTLNIMSSSSCFCS